MKQPESKCRLSVTILSNPTIFSSGVTDNLTDEFPSIINTIEADNYLKELRVIRSS